jgi:hypothetical protein
LAPHTYERLYYKVRWRHSDQERPNFDFEMKLTV